MEEPIVFALTPRAGRWNHRFLVPRGTSVSQGELMRIADSVGGCSDIVSASREVQQLNSGRPGPERLVVKDSRLRGSATPAAASVQKVLDELQDALAQLVDKIDWDKDGEQLLVERDELSEWRKQISIILVNSADSGCATASSKAQRTSGSSGNRQLRRGLGLRVLAVVCVLSVLCVLTVVGLWFAGVLQSNSDPNNGKTPVGQAPGRPEHDGEDAPDSDQKALKALAAKIGLDTPPDTHEALVIAVEARLRTLLFSEQPRHVSDGPITGNNQTTNSQEKLLGLLKQLHQIIHKDTRLGSLTAALHNADLQSDIAKLFPDGQFNRTGLLKDDADRRELKLLAEKCDYSVVACLAEASRTSDQAKGSDGDIGRLAKVSSRLTVGHGRETPVLQRRFYLDDDIGLFNAVCSWYDDNKNDEIIRKLTSDTEESGTNGKESSAPTADRGHADDLGSASKSSGGADLIRFFDAAGRHYQTKNQDIFSHDSLQQWSTAQKRNNSKEAAFADALIRFLESCQTSQTSDDASDWDDPSAPDR